ncbi:MAG: AAA family ATPase [Solirubrobacteraceae bacterium]|nr:AAA family ATPase [Solirubrobacteraceae bacterium]
MSSGTSITGPGPGPSWELIGRDGELVRIRAAIAPGAVGALLVGEAGVGKSRLAREALAAAAADGATTHWVQATASAAGVPLGAFAGLLPHDVGSDEILPAMRGAVAHFAPAQPGARTVIVIDDAHLLDPVSAALTLELVMGGTAAVIVTVRAGEVLPDAITSVWKDAGAARIEVGTLDAQRSGALTEALAGGPVDESTRQWAFASSGGNALYLRELIGGVLLGGTLIEHDGLFRMVEQPPVSATLRELISARLTGLTPDEQLALELLAVGDTLETDELAAAVGFAALETLEARGLLQVGTARSPSALRLAHPLHGEVVGAAIGTLRRTSLERRVVEILRARPARTGPESLRVASLLIDVPGDTPLDALELIEAAWAAVNSRQASLAQQIAALAIEAGGGTEARLAYARAHQIDEQAERAAELYAEIAPADLQNSAQAVRLIQHRATVLAWGLGRREEARAAVEEIVEGLPDPEWREVAAPLRILWQDLTRIGDEEIEATRRVLARSGIDEVVRRQIEPAQALQLHAAGHGPEAFAAAIGLDLPIPHRTHGDELALVALSVIGGQTGEDYPLVHMRMAEVFERGIRLHDNGAAGMAALWLSMHAISSAQLHDAARWAAEAHGLFARRNLFGSTPIASSLLAGIAAIAGDYDEARRYLDRARDETARAIAPTAMPMHLVLAEARVAQAGGDAPGAERLLIEGYQRLREREPIGSALLLVEGLSWRIPASRLAGLIDARATGRMPAAIAAHLRAADAADGRALMDVAEEYTAMGTPRYAIMAAADAARAFVAQGREDSARRAAALMDALLTETDGVRRPVIDGLGETAVGLTKREQAVVNLVREGLTNAAIAERLVLSVRTVESYVYRASQKLGVSDRHDL